METTAHHKVIIATTEQSRKTWISEPVPSLWQVTSFSFSLGYIIRAIDDFYFCTCMTLS